MEEATKAEEAPKPPSLRCQKCGVEMAAALYTDLTGNGRAPACFDCWNAAALELVKERPELKEKYDAIFRSGPF